MKTPIQYLLAAEEDITEAFKIYEQFSKGLGDRFVVAVRKIEEKISHNPRIYGTVYRSIRAAPLKRFPYVIYYRDQGSHAVVIAVHHGRRNSKNWRSRIE